MRQIKYSIVVFVLLALFLAVDSQAQGNGFFNQRDDQYRLLGLKRAKENFDVARQDYERQKEMFATDGISAAELESARRIYSEAEVNYQQSLLAVLFEEQYVSVSEAIKYQSSDGRKHVRLTLSNTSGGTEEFRQLVDSDDELFRSLQPDVTHNIYVSLLNDDNAIISQPYEAKIDQLRYGEPKQIDFTLLQDVDAVTVYLVYANGSQRTMKIFLQKDATANRVLVQSEQFSQEVDLGESANYDLTLELFSGTDNTFSLKVVNLPETLTRVFKDSSGAVRLSQVKFTESSRSKQASLQVSLPDRQSDDIAMDKAMPFYVVIVPRDKLSEIPDMTSRIWTEAELEELDVGYVRLELIPRGIGKILVRSQQLYQSIQPDESVSMFIDIVNEGSRRLDNTEVRADMPLGWTREITPTSVSAITIGDEARVNLSFTPPEDISPGKYEVRLRTSATSNSQPVNGLDKTVTIEVRPETNVVGTVAIVLALIGLIGGIVIFGIRLSKK